MAVPVAFSTKPQLAEACKGVASSKVNVAEIPQLTGSYIALFGVLVNVNVEMILAAIKHGSAKEKSLNLLPDKRCKKDQADLHYF